MSFLRNLFSSKGDDAEFAEIQAKLKTTDEQSKDPWSYESLSENDLTRQKFSYQQLVNLGWWPDCMMQFIQVNRLAYVDLMHLYEKYISAFDEPLRSFISWLHANKKKDSKLKELCRSFFHEDQTICERYWAHVLIEDNCYMYELEQEAAIRSKNEGKHYKLFRCIRHVVLNDLYDDPMLKVYLALYNLRGGHARIDDYFRRMLYHFLNEEDFTVDLESMIFELPKEVDEYVRFCSQTQDEDILSKLVLFQNILRYAGYSILLFKQVFVNQSVDVYEDLLDFNAEQVKEASYTYKYFWEKIQNKEVEDELLLRNSTLNTILNIRKVQSRKRLQTPSYTVQNIDGKSEVRLHPKVQAETRKRSRSVGYANSCPILIKEPLAKESVKTKK